MYPYECITNLRAEAAVIEAGQLLAEGWRCRNYPCLDMTAPMPWPLAGQEQRSWNFYLHSWDMLDALLQAHSQSQGRDWLQACLPIALDWVAQHAPGTAGISPFAWYDMAVGLRSYRLAYLFDAARDAGLLDAVQQAALWQSLLDHCRYLEEDANIIFHNNHGYYQVAGQLAMGRRFAIENAGMAAALQQGRERLQRMLQQQFTAEGIHREHSPDYHRMVYETLRGLIRAELVNDAATLQLAVCVEESLSWFIQPNRRIANLGDSDHCWMGCAADEAMHLWDTPVMQHAVSAGSCGEPAPSVMAAFPEGGYFVLRQPHPQGDYSQASYLAQMAAFHSRTHKHADDLSFIWMEHGQELLVDAGRYGYLGRTESGSELWKDGHWYSDPLRVYCESTRAHNTLEFDGINYPRRGVQPYGSALRRWCRAGELVAVETEAWHFASVRHTRLLVLRPRHWLLVLDWFDDTQQQPHDVRQWFHLAPQLRLESSESGFLAHVPGQMLPLRILDLLPGSTPSRQWLGQMALAGEPTQGWWSPGECDAVPASAFHFLRQQQGHGCFATLLSFSDRLQALPQSQVHASGRHGELHWMDEHGRHHLRFDRPVNGELKIVLGH